MQSLTCTFGAAWVWPSRTGTFTGTVTDRVAPGGSSAALAAAWTQGHEGRRQGAPRCPSRLRRLRGPRRRVVPLTRPPETTASAPHVCDSSSLTPTHLGWVVKNEAWMTGEPGGHCRHTGWQHLEREASLEGSCHPFLCVVPMSTAPRQRRAGGAQAGGGETRADALLLWTKQP